MLFLFYAVKNVCCNFKINFCSFLVILIILILIISYILIFYRNFELFFEFMALKRAPICGRKVCLSFFFCLFLYLIVIILIEENKKNLTLFQSNEKWTKILWILGQYNSRHVIKHVTMKFKINVSSLNLNQSNFHRLNQWFAFPLIQQWKNIFHC